MPKNLIQATTALLIILCSGKIYCQKVSYQIDGEITTNDSIVYLNRYVQDSSLYVSYDTAIIMNKHFSFKGVLEHPDFFEISIGERSNSLFVGNEKIKAYVDSTRILIDGSRLTDMNHKYQNSILQNKLKFILLSNQRDNAEVGFKDSMQHLVDAEWQKILNTTINFIKGYPGSYVSVYLLYSMMESLQISEVKKLYRNLNPQLKSSSLGKKIKQKIDLFFVLQVGQQVPNFAVVDLKGQNTSNNSLKGTYYFINFWASWCTPCINEMPGIVKIADEFSDSNIKFLLLSVDAHLSNWQTALENNNLLKNFININLESGFRSSIARKFGITFIPSNYLIDSTGKILAKNIHVEMLEEELRKIFRKK